MAHQYSSSDDTIDVRDIIARIKELESTWRSDAACTVADCRQCHDKTPAEFFRDVERDEDNEEACALCGCTADDDEREELAAITAFMEELEGNGGDEQWRGNWYPGTLIRDSYFKDYAMELAEDIGAINNDAAWPANCIDWDQAARKLQMDYSSAEFQGVTYWYR